MGDGAHVDNWNKRPDRVKGEASKPKGSKKDKAAVGQPGGFIAPFGIGVKIGVNFGSPIFGLSYGGFAGSGGFGSPGFGKNIEFGGYNQHYVDKYNEHVKERNDRMRKHREERKKKREERRKNREQRKKSQNPKGFVPH